MTTFWKTLPHALGWHRDRGRRRDPSESRGATRPADWVMSAIIGPPDLHQDRRAEARRDTGIGQQGDRWSVRVKLMLETACCARATILPVNKRTFRSLQALIARNAAVERIQSSPASGGAFRRTGRWKAR